MNIFKTGHLSNMGDRPFDLSCHSEISTNQHPTALNLTFIRRNTRFFALFALLTYPQVEEDRLLNLEASARGIIRTAGGSIFEI